MSIVDETITTIFVKASRCVELLLDDEGQLVCVIYKKKSYSLLSNANIINVDVNIKFCM